MKKKWYERAEKEALNRSGPRFLRGITVAMAIVEQLANIAHITECILIELQEKNS